MAVSLLATLIVLSLNYCPFIFSQSINSEEEPLPNFIIMLMDDLGWGDLGCNGEPNKETPYLDEMANKGMVASSMYTASPICSPSRASLLTGRLPIRNGFYTNTTDGRNAYTPQEIVGGIPETEILLSELLLQKNYTNALIGKWHLGHQEKYLPLKRGFHKFFGSTNCHFGPYDNRGAPNIPFYRDDKMIGRYFDDFSMNHATGESNLTKMFTNEAVAFIEGRKGQKNPFFLLWSPDSNHSPTYASKDFLHSSRRFTYGASVMEVDFGVGSILTALDHAGLRRNTLIVFTSDNGAALVSGRDGGTNGPLRCGKQTTFEGGMRVPGIFYWPGKVAAGTTTHHAWTHMDLFSTLLELAGIDIPKDRVIDGLPLVKSLLNPYEEFARPVFFYRGNRLMALRLGSYKMHTWTWNTTPQEIRAGVDYCPGEKLDNVITSDPFDHRKQPVLFHIEADPGEQRPINPNSAEYKSNIGLLMGALSEHEKNLVKGNPELNWCDRSVMNWAPPGCKELGRCLSRPQSRPYLCNWTH